MAATGVEGSGSGSAQRTGSLRHSPSADGEEEGKGECAVRWRESRGRSAVTPMQRRTTCNGRTSGRTDGNRRIRVVASFHCSRSHGHRCAIMQQSGCSPLHCDVQHANDVCGALEADTPIQSRRTAAGAHPAPLVCSSATTVNPTTRAHCLHSALTWQPQASTQLHSHQARHSVPLPLRSRPRWICAILSSPFCAVAHLHRVRATTATEQHQQQQQQMSSNNSLRP